MVELPVGAVIQGNPRDLDPGEVDRDVGAVPKHPVGLRLKARVRRRDNHPDPDRT
jgi:hypothetical protein